MGRGQIEKKLVELEGEYRVAAEIASLGLVPIPMPRNYPATDIIVVNPANGRTAQVQVKTRDRSPKRNFLLHAGDEQFEGDNRFYVLVNLQGRGSPPEVFVVPSRVVATRIGSDHRAYVSAGHANSGIRRFTVGVDDRRRFQDNWDPLKGAVS